jgi:hypothetical protein
MDRRYGLHKHHREGCYHTKDEQERRRETLDERPIGIHPTWIAIIGVVLIVSTVVFLDLHALG